MRHTATPSAWEIDDLPVPRLCLRQLRRPDDDVPMNDVANASRQADGEGFSTTPEQFAAHYDHLSNCDPERDVAVAEMDGQQVAYGRVWWVEELTGNVVYGTLGHVHPEARRRGVGRALLAWQEARVRDIAAGQAQPAGERLIEAEASAASPGREALLRAAGFAPVRWGFEMIRPTLDDQPDAPMPAGLEIREVEPGHMRAIWEAEVEAFRDHWGAAEPTEADFERFVSDPVETDTSLWRVAWDGEQVAGMVRSYINAEENERYGRRLGWVENISVRRPWRRRGLARALIAASLPLLRARGMREGALGVDAENVSGALRLYQSVGFVESARFGTWRKPL